MLSGQWKDRRLGSGSDGRKLFDMFRTGRITEEEWAEVEGGLARSAGHCTVMGTASTMTSLAEALGMRLVVSLVPSEEQAGVAASPEMPASLVRLGRTARFRQAVKVIATALDLDAGEFAVQLIAALALIAQSLGRDLAEADWWRLLDALLLVAAHPAS